jgi:hypothetical protein
MNDPDIADEPMALREVHAIRLMLRDETRNMTSKEHAAFVNREAQSIIDRYGLNLKNAEPTPR